MFDFRRCITRTSIRLLLIEFLLFIFYASKVFAQQDFNKSSNFFNF